MQVNVDLVTLLIGVTIVLCLFISVLVMTVKKKHKTPNVFLALLLMMGSVSLLGAVLYQTDVFRYLPQMIRLNEPIRFLIAPLFYFYALSLTREFKWRPIMVLHSIPFLSCFLYLFPFYLQSPGYKINYVVKNMLPPQGVFVQFNLVSWIFFIVQLVLYLWSVKLMLKRFEEKIKANFSSVDKINLEWLNHFVIGAIIICGYLLAFITVSFFGHPGGRAGVFFLRPIPSVISLFIIFLVFRTLRQPQILMELNWEERDPSRPKYEKSTLTSEEAGDYYQRLDRHMKTEKPYLQSELTLQQLADELQIPVRHLSQVINEKTGLNFYHYINSYRVEVVKSFFVDSDQKNKPILEIAFEAGFNSKATFNAVFKQFTGMTPRQFRQKEAGRPDNEPENSD